jgi:hypothetical protein
VVKQIAMKNIDLVGAGLPVKPVAAKSALDVFLGLFGLGTVVALFCYVLVRIVIWFESRPIPSETEVIWRISYIVVVFLASLPLVLQGAAIEKGMLLYFGPFSRSPKQWGFSRVITATLASEEFLPKIGLLLRQYYQAGARGELGASDNELHCRVRPAGSLRRYDIDVRHLEGLSWAFTVARSEMRIFQRISIVQADVAQLLGSLLLMAAREGLIVEDFPQGVPRERILRDLAKLPH